MFLDKLFPQHLIEYNKELIIASYQKDKETIEQQLIPPICTQIHTDTIAKLEDWSKKLKTVGLNDQSKEAHGLALRGCAAYWINLLGNYGPNFDGEQVLLGVLEMEKRIEKEKNDRALSAKG